MIILWNTMGDGSSTLYFVLTVMDLIFCSLIQQNYFMLYYNEKHIDAKNADSGLRPEIFYLDFSGTGTYRLP